jgi:hypothetical protein
MIIEVISARILLIYFCEFVYYVVTYRKVETSKKQRNLRSVIHLDAEVPANEELLCS